jgi:hypothetical protein
MALTDTLTLDDATGDETAFVLLFKDQNQTKRIDSAGTLAAPRTCVVKHSSSGKGTNIIDRHLIQFTELVQDAAGVDRTAVVNLTMAVPRSSVITNAKVIDLVSFLVDLICDGSFSSSGIGGTVNITALLQGQS